MKSKYLRAFGPTHAVSFSAALLLLTGASISLRADPASELASFSVFDKVDLNELAKGDAKTVHGPPMGGRFLSVQSCYVTSGAPARQVEALRKWNPTRHSELKVFLHSDLSSSPNAANFSKIGSESAARGLLAATQKMGTDLQISKEEAKKSTGNAAAFWGEVLASRASSFVRGGTAAQPPYDHTGETIKPNEELNSLLRQQDKIRKQFAGLLASTGIGRGAGGSAELYWELLEVDDASVVTLGASYNRAGGGGTHQAADVLYYASGGYYVALTLYQMWPVTIDGKASTLVWRGDMISAASLASLHGVERLASESAMVKDISKAVTFLRRDTGGR